MDDNEGCNLEVVIDRILFSIRDLKKKMDYVKENKFRVKNRSDSFEYRDLQRIRDLEKENIELRQALEDYQYGCEFIMSKYRSQVTELMQLNKVEKTITPPQTMIMKRNNSLE